MGYASYFYPTGRVIKRRFKHTWLHRVLLRFFFATQLVLSDFSLSDLLVFQMIVTWFYWRRRWLGNHEWYFSPATTLGRRSGWIHACPRYRRNRWRSARKTSFLTDGRRLTTHITAPTTSITSTAKPSTRTQWRRPRKIRRRPVSQRRYPRRQVFQSQATAAPTRAIALTHGSRSNRFSSRNRMK